MEKFNFDDNFENEFEDEFEFEEEEFELEEEKEEKQEQTEDDRNFSNLHLQEGREIGIDLGTTNSVVSFIDNDGSVNYVRVANNILIPSQIFFKEGVKEPYFGNKAKNYAKGMAQGVSIKLFKKYLRTDSKKFHIRLPKYFDKQSKTYYYILDTNVFIDQPEILEYMEENEKVILPITVEQELEYRRTVDDTKYCADKAIEQLIKHRSKVTYVESDITLLPEDFFKNFSENFNNANNDNKILSVAMKYKEQEGVLISSDNRLVKLKSEFVGVKAMTLTEFMMARLNKIEYEEFDISGTEATSMFLKYLKQEAERVLKEKVTKAVITVPATFNIVEIENTKKAGLEAGFIDIHIEKEPTAAAIAYHIDANVAAKTFVYDFGGGTFDVSIIESDANGNFKICATAGNSKLGGEDITNKIEEYIYEYLEDNYDLSMFTKEESELSEEHYAYNIKTIYWAAENCKIELSMSENTTMTLIDIYLNDKEQKSVFIDMSRSDFENIIKLTINQTFTEMNNGLSRAELFKEDIDNIILAGGTSLIPCVAEQVERYFGRKAFANKNAATLIAEGAAIIANALYGKHHLIKMKPKVFDMTYEDFGVALEKWEYSCIIPAGTSLPICAEKKYSLVEDNQKQLNIKVFSRSNEVQNAVKTYDKGVEYLDEIIMKNLPSMKMEDVDVIVKFEITKQYALLIDVKLIKKDGTLIEKGNMIIDRQSMMN